jgi:predicted RNA-binding Zn-ribbon protein involved in translation (DUF1610 family)
MKPCKTKSQTVQEIYCPNCGGNAKQISYHHQKITEIACPQCDYLLVRCSDTGRVVEAYAPGLVFNH